VTASSAQDNGGSVVFNGSGWKTLKTSAAYGGSLHYASSAGRTARLAFTGTQVALVSTEGKDRGKAQVLIDNTLVATLDLYAPSTRVRQIVFRSAVLTAGPHTITVKVLGTKRSKATGARVDLDGFLLRP